MQLDEIYKHIMEFDHEEAIGYEYFKRTNQYLDYIDLVFLLKTGTPHDFSSLSKTAAQAHKDDILSKLKHGYLEILQEQLFIPHGTNAEIQHLPRYIDIAKHKHGFFEIVCTIEGTCLHCIEDKKIFMHQGDVTIIPPNVKHHLLAEPDCTAFTIKIRKTTFDNVFSVFMRSGSTLSAYFSQTLYSKQYQNSLTFHCGQDTFLSDLLLYMFAQQIEKKLYYNYVLDGMLTTFFSYLVQNYEDTIELASGSNKLNERMTAIENYMWQNYQTATLTGTANHFYISPAYLSTMVKKQTGYTFSHIMQKIRMEHAAQLLTETDMKVEQVCDKVGYQDTTQFIRTFKKYYGTTPHRFRTESASTASHYKEPS